MGRPTYERELLGGEDVPSGAGEGGKRTRQKVAQEGSYSKKAEKGRVAAKAQDWLSRRSGQPGRAIKRGGLGRKVYWTYAASESWSVW